MDKFVITMKKRQKYADSTSVDQTETSIRRSLSETESVSDPVDKQSEQEPPEKKNTAKKI
jgi:hypothetical protein